MKKYKILNNEEMISDYFCNNCHARQDQLFQLKIRETINFLQILDEMFNDSEDENIPF